LPVFAPHRITEAEGERVIEGCPEAVALNKPPASYNPMGSRPEEILQAVYSLREDERTVLDFCDRYGLLGGDGATPTSPAITPFFGIWRQTWQGFWREVAEIKAAIEAVKVISARDPDDAASWHTVQAYLNRVLDGVSIYVALLRNEAESDGAHVRIVTRLRYRTLSQAVAVAVYSLLTEGKGLRSCENPKCGRLFVPRHKNQRFCPTPPGYSRSPCENNFNQLRHRLRTRKANNAQAPKEGPGEKGEVRHAGTGNGAGTGEREGGVEEPKDPRER